MIQVRLSDTEMDQFEKVKVALKQKTNAATLRELIQLVPLVGEEPQKEVKHFLKVYDDLDARTNALLWNSSNMTKNLNEIAHAANIAKENDPANVTTWNWIIEQLRQIFPTVKELNKQGKTVDDFLKKELDSIGDT